MPQRHKSPVKYTYASHLIRNAFIALLAVFVATYMGMLGYHYFENMSWVDSFANAAMILSGMGPLEKLNTVDGKIFAGFYALFSGLMFILLLGLILSPLLHKIFIKFHVDTSSK